MEIKAYGSTKIKFNEREVSRLNYDLPDDQHERARKTSYQNLVQCIAGQKKEISDTEISFYDQCNVLPMNYISLVNIEIKINGQKERLAMFENYLSKMFPDKEQIAA